MKRTLLCGGVPMDRWVGCGRCWTFFEQIWGTFLRRYLCQERLTNFCLLHHQRRWRESSGAFTQLMKNCVRMDNLEGFTGCAITPGITLEVVIGELKNAHHFKVILVKFFGTASTNRQKESERERAAPSQPSHYKLYTLSGVYSKQERTPSALPLTPTSWFE